MMRSNRLVVINLLILFIKDSVYAFSISRNNQACNRLVFESNAPEGLLSRLRRLPRNIRLVAGKARRRRWFIKRQLKKRRQQQQQQQLHKQNTSLLPRTDHVRAADQNDNETVAEATNLTDVWGIERVKSDLNLPDWLNTTDLERTHLAAMKILLRTDFEQLERQTVDMSTASTAISNCSLVDAFPDVYGDLRLIRFLRKDQKQDPVSAALRYQSFLNWRQENDIDRKIRLPIETTGPFQPNFHPLLSQLLPVDFELGERLSICCKSNTTTTAVLPIVLHVNQWDIMNLHEMICVSEKISLDDFLSYWAYMFESLHAHLYQLSLQRRELVYVDEIISLENIRLAFLPPTFVSRVLRPWIHMMQNHYPETSYRIRFFKAHPVISMAWKIVAVLLSPGTIAKIQFVSTTNRPKHDTLQEFVDKEYPINAERKREKAQKGE